MKFIGTISGTALDFGKREDAWNLFTQDRQGKKVLVSDIKPKRSNSQNAYYWLYLGVIESETGNGANELHEYFKRALLPPKFITVLEKEIKIPRSTSELTKAEFGEYMDKICSETGVPLPDPEEAGYITNY